MIHSMIIQKLHEKPATLCFDIDRESDLEVVTKDLKVIAHQVYFTVRICYVVVDYAREGEVTISANFPKSGVPSPVTKQDINIQ